MLRYCGDIDYWDARYTKDPEPYDWYLTFNEVRPLLEPLLHRNLETKILNVGCGNSEFGTRLYQEGFRFIMNIDFSGVVIRQMLERTEKVGWPKFQVMDAQDIKFSTASFDLAVDKGTLDSIMCGESAGEKIRKSLLEIYRVLRPQGVFVCFSHGHPSVRNWELKVDEAPWDVEFVAIRKRTPEEKLREEQVDGVSSRREMAERTLRKNQLPPKGEELNHFYMYVCKKGTVGPKIK